MAAKNIETAGATLRAVETVDTRGNITRHAARSADGRVRCGWGGTADTNHPDPTIPSTLEEIHCGRCRRLVVNDRIKQARFKRRGPRLMR